MNSGAERVTPTDTGNKFQTKIKSKISENSSFDNFFKNLEFFFLLKFGKFHLIK